MSAELIEFSNALAEITERTAKFCVAVHAEPRGSSSGVVWRSGVIVTADHALRRDDEIHVTLPDGRVVPATLVGRDPSTDIAVLRCTEAVEAVPSTNEAASLKPGNLVLAVGRTRASGPVVALGALSLVTKERHTWTGVSLSPYVRLDMSLQPTATGGAVVDAAGAVVGMASARFARFGVTAIPASTVDQVAAVLLQKGHMPQGYLGVGLQPVRLPVALRETLGGQKTAVIVLEVEPESPAQKAGVVIGDVLVMLAGAPVVHPGDVQAQLQGNAIGKSVAGKVVRGGALHDLNFVIGERARGSE